MESENIRARHIPNPLCKINKSIIKIRTYVITVITRKTLVVFIGELFFCTIIRLALMSVTRILEKISASEFAAN